MAYKTSKIILGILGAVFLILGILGFFQDPVLGTFAVSMSRVWLYLLTGIVALVFAYGSERGARQFSRVFFVVYLLIALFGFISTNNTVLGLFPASNADNYLNALFALVFLVAGFIPSSESRMIDKGRATDRPVHGTY
jgi:uncharacterized membrane protein HdeD (DUF308 family)